MGTGQVRGALLMKKKLRENTKAKAYYVSLVVI